MSKKKSTESLHKGMTFEEAKASHHRIRRPNWGKSQFLRYRELDPNAWDANDCPPNRGAWDPIAEKNFLGLSAEDLSATDWEFWSPIMVGCSLIKEGVVDIKGNKLLPTEELDLVEHPPHYNHGPIEVIDIIEGFHLPYHLGNVVKYILRAGHKEGSASDQDLKKARWYLDRYIEKLSSKKGRSSD